MRTWIGTGIFEFAKDVSIIPHLTGETLRSTRFSCPPREGQDRIVRFLHREAVTIDLLTTEAQRLELLQERRTTLISATGKFDVYRLL